MIHPRRVYPTGCYGLALATALVTAVMVSVTVAAPGSAGLRAGGDRFTLYSRAEQEQYINNQDDRERGKGKNPFGNYRDTSPAQTKSANGPFPGDEAVFSFNLYTAPGLTGKTGTAIFTCEYNFDRNAFCDAAFRMTSGTVLAEGSFSFVADSFTLAVTGGYDGYNGAKGTVQETPSPNHAQKLSFHLR